MNTWNHNHVFGDLAKFDKYFVGFDKMFDRIQNSQEAFQKVVSNYPPYNIVMVDDNKYVIELAVAGFGKQNIDVEFNDGTLTITGSTTADEQSVSDLFPKVVYKGISDRAFTRKFTLADTIEIKNAELINGMLKIWLENIIPDSKKPKKIEINSKDETPSDKVLLTEDTK